MAMSNGNITKEQRREWGRKGGKTTVARHGASHMSAIGVKGFLKAAEAFRSVSEYKQWRALTGVYVYWVQSGRPEKWDRDGNPIYPNERPKHPNDPDYVEF